MRKALEVTRQVQKRQADKKTAPQREFRIGDVVYLSMRFLQLGQHCKKLGPKYIGPFPIIQIVNPVTVELKPPKNFRCIHSVFHCSLLKSSIAHC